MSKVYAQPVAEGKGLTIKPHPEVDMLEGLYMVDNEVVDPGNRTRYPAGVVLEKPPALPGFVGGTSYWLTTDQLRWLVTTGGPAALAVLERGGAA